MHALDEQVRKAAFQRLYRERRSASVAQLAADTGLELEKAASAVETMRGEGRIRVAEDGSVIGSCGLAVRPDRHELWIGERRFWTWCALDAVGILGALAATGRLVSRSPQSGATIEVHFTAGLPEATPAVVFVAERRVRVSVYDEWCSLLNLFEDAPAAESWASATGVAGSHVAVPDLAPTVAERWKPLVDGLV